MASGGTIFTDPGFWVAATGVTFIGLVWWKGGFKVIASMLDKKIDKIKKDIDDAAKLRNQAEILLAKYQKQQREAEKTAADIIKSAEKEANDLLAKAESDIAAMIARRSALAADRIAQAEANAIKQVRATAATVAIEAATDVLSNTLKGPKGSFLINDAIADVEKCLT